MKSQRCQGKIGVLYLPKFVYLKRFRRRSKLLKSKLNQANFFASRYAHIALSFCGSFLGISALENISGIFNYPLIVAPFGATSVLAFAIPESPLAQPRNIICGNFLGALVGLSFFHLFGSQGWVMPAAVATAIAVMQITKTLHPAAGAVALVAVMSKASWDFLLRPVLLGSIILVICTVLFNNFVARKSYPKQWL
ncbi:HPP family protein [Ancylothrix sp. C2]|uniref:HPP family protein n=1 Tax=Ancylothrix sp. D3o TaxID=2953691 RepID=UPI0021BAFCAB|nr:HPP family protein [Ancylothrix sp. D3o]MCT7951504.1 HPP family protein [Ancylothrix sp. D3o]